MNGAQPSIFANKRRRQKQWVGYLPATLWLGDFIHLQCNSGLREQPAVDGCVSLYGDQCLAQDDALEVWGCSEHGESGNLPEYVFGLCATFQVNGDAVTFEEIARNLEDPHLVRGAGEGDICLHTHTCAPFVEAGSECHSSNDSPAKFGEIRV